MAQAVDTDGSRPRWEHFAHGADIGIRGFGPSMVSAFEQVALALTAVVTDPARVRSGIAVSLSCEAPDRELLLVDWLNALVYEMSTQHLLFGRYEVRVDGSRLEGTAWGEPVDLVRHAPAVEVKGATYTALEVHESNGFWTAQCVVDV